ncbi:MAG TPA: TonB family protein [Thermoanaerobaculia bacterium]|nr:TonB family protein [Thermoanaerobaculia bacterium]
MKIRLLASVSLLLFTASTSLPLRGLQPETPVPAQRPPALTESLNRAYQLIGDGKFKEARAELEQSQALAGGPCGECLLGMAHVYASEKDWKRTKETLEQAIPLLKSPGLQARAYNQLGTALFQSKAFHSKKEAEDAFRTAASKGGAWGMLARYNLAELQLVTERWEEAAETARTYLKEAGPDGAARDQARIVLCQARSHLKDDPPTVANPSSDTRKVEGEVTRPEILFQQRPVYTEQARMAKTTGIVILEAIIDKEGCVRSMRPLQELGNGLTEAAMTAVQQWVFKPATLQGEPVRVFYVLTVNFQVQASPPPAQLPGTVP